MSVSYSYPAVPNPELSVVTRCSYFGQPYVYYTYRYNSNYKSARTGIRDKNRFTFLKENGFLPQNAYSMFGHDPATVTPVTFSVTRKSDGYVSVGTVLVQAYPSMLSPEISATPRVVAANASMLNDHASYINKTVRNQYYSVYETLYEGRKTKNMILKAVRDVSTCLWDIKRGRFSSAAKRLGLSKTPKGVSKNRTLHDNWLEYRYGWIPLYSTVYGEMKRQFDHMKHKEPIRRVSFSSVKVLPVTTSTAVSNISVDNLTGRTMGGYVFNSNRKVFTELRMRSTYFYKVHNPGLASQSELGLTNPILFAWEALPLSFVADWFLNVSDVLGQFDAWVGKSVVASSRAFVVDSTVTGYATIVSSPNPTYYNSSISNPSVIGRLRRCSVDRVVGLPPPTVLPEFQAELNPKRLVDAIALLVQRCR